MRPKRQLWWIMAALDGERRRLKARGSVWFTLARETGDYPLFYREVNLPFVEAVKAPTRIRWRFGAIDRGELTRAALSTGGSAKSKFLSVSKLLSVPISSVLYDHENSVLDVGYRSGGVVGLCRVRQVRQDED